MSAPKGFEMMEFETSEFILSAMRNGMIIPHKRDDELLRYYADFLDNALKRERKQGLYAVVEEMSGEIARLRRGVACCGGAAAARKALEEVEGWLAGALRWCHRECSGDVVKLPAYSGFWILDKIKGMLAAPARNAEVYPSRHAAFAAYKALRPVPHWFEEDGVNAFFAVEFGEWLWLPVKPDNRYTHKEHDKWLVGAGD